MSWAFAERFASQAVSIVVAIVLARFLAPELFGVVSIVTVLIAICDCFVIAGLGNALIQKKDADELDYSSILIFSFVLSIFIYLLAYISAEPIADFYQMPELDPVIKLMAIRLPVASINSVQHAYVSRKMKFKLLFYVTFVGVVISGIVGVLMAVLGYGVYALVGQFLLNMIIDTVLLFVVLKKTVRLRFSYERLKTLLPFGLSVMLSELASTFGSNVRTMVIGKGFPAAQLAFYAKGNQFSTVLVSNVNSSLGKVLFPALVKQQDQVEEAEKLSTRIMQTSLFLLTPLLILIYVCADPLVRILYNDQWLGMIPYVQVLALSFILIPIQTTSLQRIMAAGKGKEYLIIQITKISIGLVLMFGAVIFFDDAIFVAYSSLLSSIINTVIHFGANKLLFQQSITSQFGDISKIGLINIILVAALLLINPADKLPYLSLPVKIVACFAIYVALCECLKSPVYPQIKRLTINIVKTKIRFS